jgi:hypothetical protein
MGKLAALHRPGRGLLFEGQTRFSFLAEAAALAGGVPHHPILIDCDDETRARRLTVDRMQPQLADATMMNWARYLRSEAIKGGYEILDTSGRQLSDSVQYVVERLGR